MLIYLFVFSSVSFSIIQFLCLSCYICLYLSFVSCVCLSNFDFFFIFLSICLSACISVICYLLYYLSFDLFVSLYVWSTFLCIFLWFSCLHLKCSFVCFFICLSVCISVMCEQSLFFLLLYIFDMFVSLYFLTIIIVVYHFFVYPLFLLLVCLPTSTTSYFQFLWKPLNVITLELRETDNINRKINRAEFFCKILLWWVNVSKAIWSQ